MSGDGFPSDPPATSEDPDAAAASGTAFGRFRQLHQIGLGGLGPVFRGRDAESLDSVAIKHLQLKAGPERTRLIADELRALVERTPAHPHLARPIAAGLSGGDLLLVSELVPGEGLDAALREYGPAAIVDAIPRLAQLADALDQAAAVGLWHGALHPSDIVVAANETHLTGLGVAPILEQARVPLDQRLPYAAPEVLASHPSSPRSDQYALAAIAHEWLFGIAVIGPAEAAMIVPDLPGVDRDALGDAFTSALAPDPDARFPSCGAFVARLRAAAPALVWPLPAAAERPQTAGDVSVNPPGPEARVAPVQIAFDELPLEGERQKAPPRPREPNATVQWRGQLGAAMEPATPTTDGRGSTLVALAAVFVLGMALGGAGGYLAGRRAPGADATAKPSAADPAAPGGSANATAGAPDVKSRAFTETPVPASADPPVAPAPAVSPAVAPSPASAAPPPEGVAGSESAAARLLVRDTPAGASVTVDGRARGTTPLVLGDLALGTRSVVITRRGYVPAERRVTLSRDRPSRSIDVSLTPVSRASAPAARAPTPTTGSLLIESRPPGATVVVDGRPAGVTPLTIASVTPGRHTVVISAAGLTPVTSTIDVKAGERVRVAATLVGGRQQE